MPFKIPFDTHKKSILEHLEDSPLENKEYTKEYVQVILLAMIFFVLVSVITYNPSDPSTFNIHSSSMHKSEVVTNTFGPLGAWLSDWGYQIFGLGAILFSLIFLVQLLNTFRKPPSKSRFALRLFGYPQLVICYLGLVSGISPSIYFRGIDMETGGVLGHGIFHFFSTFLGSTGSLMALSVGALSSLTLCLGVRPLSTVRWFFSFLPFHKWQQMANQVLSNEQEKNLEQNEKPSPFWESQKVLVEGGLLESKPHFQQTMGEEWEPIVDMGSSPKQDIVVSQEHFESLISLLDYHKNVHAKKNLEEEQLRLKSEASQIEEKLSSFGVMGTVVQSHVGPVFNVHEFEPAVGIKINKIIVLQDDLTLALKAQNVSIGLQPGKNTLGIEVPSQNREVVSLREMMEAPQFQNQKALLPVALGKNVMGEPLISDLSIMPHLLVAGATGSGKSVCIHNILLSLMICKTPAQLKFILIDPKMLEMSQYDGIGHLLMPVVNNAMQAAGALKWAVQEMERRYLLMKNYQVRNILAFNTAVAKEELRAHEGQKPLEPMPYLVIAVDELCDLMMTAPKEVEDSIQRLAQKARAAGIHLILATQRPSVDVLTGVIKANLPCRLSFQVASRHDSRTIIENIGAERLLGKGDMLFVPPGLSKMTHGQCAFVTDKEILALCHQLRVFYPTDYNMEMLKEIEFSQTEINQKSERSAFSVKGNLEKIEFIDENQLYEKAVEFAQETGNGSALSFQREFRIPYNQAARILDRMLQEGLVGQKESTGKPRPIILRKK